MKHVDLSTTDVSTSTGVMVIIGPPETVVEERVTHHNFSQNIHRLVRNLFMDMHDKLVSIYKNLNRSEISGSLGDLGTYIPLVVVLARKRSIYLAPALFFGGLSNLLTGLIWDVPMCVQPMKSIAAVAIASNWNAQTVSASGLLVGGLVFLVGTTNLIELVNFIVPVPVVAGLQIGVGLNLAISGIKSIQKLKWVNSYDCILLAFLVSLLCLYWLREERLAEIDHIPKENTPHTEDEEKNDLDSTENHPQRVMLSKFKDFWKKKSPHPVGIYLFIIGIIFAGIKIGNSKKAYESLRFFGAPVALLALKSVKASEWEKGLVDGALPQLPLTCLNSIIAVCALAHGLYPEKRKACHDHRSSDAVVGRRQVAVSVGLMNLLFVPFGSMPYCHGSGGLAGQHKMGARHGASVVFLGLMKMLLAIFFGAAALTLLDAIPVAILGVMVTIAGHELATTGYYFLVSDILDDADFINMTPTSKKITLRRNISICMVTTIVIVATGQVHYGVIAGWVTHMIYGDGLAELLEWISWRRSHCTWCRRIRMRRSMNANTTV